MSDGGEGGRRGEERREEGRKRGRDEWMDGWMDGGMEGGREKGKEKEGVEDEGRKEVGRSYCTEKKMLGVDRTTLFQNSSYNE